MPNGPYDTAGSEKLVVFAQKKVMLSSDLSVNSMLRKSITDKITKGEGEVVESVEDCDMFICQYREGDQYIRAAQQGKDVGNLAWLYHLMVYNEWTSPFRRLLHYPQPRLPLPGFEDMRITLSNYGGEARIYLENLIRAAGATYTRTMKAENTHLITARMHSEKVDAARDWNIEIANHLWIEESYAACQALPLNNPRYRHFPLRTNLGEVIGQTFLDEPALREMYYPGGEDTMDDAARKKRKISKFAQQNTYNVGLEEDFSVMQDSSPALALSTRKPRATPALGKFSTPAKGRHVLSGKENDTPSVMSSASRSAKAQALSKLQDLAPDIALYEKEKKRAGKDGHGIWGGKRAADQLDKERADRRSSSPPGEVADDDEEAEDADAAKRPAKRARLALPEIDMRVSLTGYRRWVENKSAEEADRVRGCQSRFAHTLLISATEETPLARHSNRTRKRTVQLPRRPRHGTDDEIPPMPRPGPRCDQFVLHHGLYRDGPAARYQGPPAGGQGKRGAVRRHHRHGRLPRPSQPWPAALGGARLLHGRHPQRR